MLIFYNIEDMINSIKNDYSNTDKYMNIIIMMFIRNLVDAKCGIEIIN